ncbi:GNAT family N-acetyltransferase [Thermoleophilia bacterium SCSIO 60948]|nr:GNAT family N-acetyltransferase [Thermoleophilia bacterium SCSIO 60948]
MAEPRPCSPDERDAILAIVNAAAEAYRGVIPADCWHEPYMPGSELDAEIEAGVRFWGIDGADARLDGVMGIQDVGDVTLIRHAYVRPDAQGAGVGRRLLGRLVGEARAPLLVGTWTAAEWAIRFYERNGFERCDPSRARELFERYWTLPERQVEASAVLELTASA